MFVGGLDDANCRSLGTLKSEDNGGGCGRTKFLISTIARSVPVELGSSPSKSILSDVQFRKEQALYYLPLFLRQEMTHGTVSVRSSILFVMRKRLLDALYFSSSIVERARKKKR